MTKKLNKKEQDNIRPVSHEEFNQAIKILLNSPPRKKRKEGK